MIMIWNWYVSGNKTFTQYFTLLKILQSLKYDVSLIPSSNFQDLDTLIKEPILSQSTRSSSNHSKLNFTIASSFKGLTAISFPAFSGLLATLIAAAAAAPEDIPTWFYQEIF